MTGLDKIINQIQLDAENTCKSIISKNEAACESVIAKAQAEADAIVNDAGVEAEDVFNNIISRAQSTAELESRKSMLSVKQQIIASVIENFHQKLIDLPNDDYFDLIYKLITKYSESKSGVIAFNDADLNRLPEDFILKANSVSKGELTLSDSSVAVDSGFVLIYGGVEVNCSFASLFSDNSEKISDSVSSVLFA